MAASMKFNASTENNVQCLSLELLPQIVGIHQNAFPQSAFTQLGQEAISRYYRWLLDECHDAANVGIFDENHLAGFCFSGKFRGAMSGYLDRNASFLARQVIMRPWLLITNEVFRSRMIKGVSIFRRRRALQQNTSVNPSPSFGILSIAVNGHYQGKGYGKHLMEATERIARLNDYSMMNLTVAVNNVQAIHFYEKLGWQHVVNTSGSWTGQMTKMLSR